MREVELPRDSVLALIFVFRIVSEVLAQRKHFSIRSQTESEPAIGGGITDV